MEGRPAAPAAVWGKAALWRVVLPRPPLCGGEMFAVIATECDVRVSDVSRRSRRTARADRTKICFRKHHSDCFCKHSDVVCWPWPNTAAAFGHLLPQGFSAIYYLPPQVFGSLYTPPGTARADWAKQPFHPFCASCISHAGRAPPRNAAFAVARFDGGASVGRAVRRAGLY